jgi:homoserine dehydrogenase
MSKKLNIGLFGFGVVGQGLYDVLNKTQGTKAQIHKICVKDRSKPRSLPSEYFTFDKEDILSSDEIDVVVELIDNAEDAFEIVSTALRKGKAVVTANKKMLAERFQELFDLQHRHQAPLLYEAATCGSIPIIRNLEEYYDNDFLSALEGIFNGTTNYILTKVFEENKSYQEVLRAAQVLGFAESDPTLDVEGFDAKYKLCILMAHAFGVFIEPQFVFNYGISKLSVHDIQYAREKNSKIKLVAHGRKHGEKLAVYVMPQFVDQGHLLYNVHNEYNGVVVEALFSDKQFFLGKGAGGHPTASAVLSDIAALTYDYRYEYKKLHQPINIRYSTDLEMKVYYRYSREEQLNRLRFNTILERYESQSYRYVIGTLQLSELIASEIEKEEGVFLVQVVV